MGKTKLWTVVALINGELTEHHFTDLEHLKNELLRSPSAKVKVFRGESVPVSIQTQPTVILGAPKKKPGRKPKALAAV